MKYITFPRKTIHSFIKVEKWIPLIRTPHSPMYILNAFPKNDVQLELFNHNRIVVEEMSS